MKSTINPAQILDSYRKSDAVIIVCQNNHGKSIQVEALNAEAVRVTGFSADELVGKAFFSILPDRIQSTITEFVDYKDEQHDLLAVLMKIRNFSIKGRSGQEQTFRLRVIRGDEVDRNPWFHLVLEDEGKQLQAIAVRQNLKESFKSNDVDGGGTSSGLPSRVSTLKNMEVVVQSVQSGQIKASFAIMDINNYAPLKAEHGDDISYRLQRHIGQLCKQKLRPEDTVGSLNDRMIGLLLVDAAQEEARQVLNRLRWIVSVSPLEMGSKEISTQVNVGFSEIDGKITAAEILEKCEGYVMGMRRKLVNTIELVVTHERRAVRDERRKVNLPVDMDRRKKDRRN
jgi:GGDEF domain-containing protein